MSARRESGKPLTGKKKHSIVIRLLPLLAAVALLVLADFLRLRFEVGESTVSWGFGVFGRTFEREAITSCEIHRITFWNYLGLGIRFGILDGTIGYVNHFGEGIKLDISGKKRAYVLSVKDPAAACALLAREN